LYLRGQKKKKKLTVFSKYSGKTKEKKIQEKRQFLSKSNVRQNQHFFVGICIIR